MRLCHKKDQLYVRLQKSRGAESLADWRGEKYVWCEQPGYCSHKNCHIAVFRGTSTSCVSLALVAKGAVKLYLALSSQKKGYT